ncbi:MAG: hypothetical protein HQL96_07640 [Magnetococcales bacterium]|nr:hypothetical protein [Magnetococcales bacterium]
MNKMTMSAMAFVAALMVSGISMAGSDAQATGKAEPAVKNETAVTTGEVKENKGTQPAAKEQKATLATKPAAAPAGKQAVDKGDKPQAATAAKSDAKSNAPAPVEKKETATK